MVDVVMEQLKDYNSPIYDEQRRLIEKYRAKKYSWEQIKYGRGETEEDLVVFINDVRDLNDWDITADDWKELVELERQGEEKRLNIAAAEKHSIIDDGNEDNDLSIPFSKTSCWQKYKNYLLDEKGFKRDDVIAIENSSFRILKRLNSNTKKNPVKGLVVGNVQSGKTANMAALMAMAADYGWNMFIVLSGTIENLRIQTLERLINDLKRPGCNLAWQGISRPSRKCQPEDQAQNLLFEKQSHMRYLTVSLKNSTRLKNLLQWLHADKKSAELMKIMVIDDESDQAGINTKKEDSEERTRINQLIINLVENKDDQGNEAKDCFKAMNYIGYTATPYANVLNEASKESLYPRNFISTLQVSKTYFGPQQIFGDRENNTYDGLDIVRRINGEDIIQIKNIHDGRSHFIPESFERAICWFLCCVAIERYKGSKKPVSMLVHTSQMQKHHEEIRRAVEKWFCNSNEYIVSKCREVWEYERVRFTRDTLIANYPDFGEPIENIDENPAFNEIEPLLLNMITVGLTNIMLGGEGELCYSNGIHLCVDDAKNQGINSEGAHMRIIYPEDNSKLSFATAFIVIGGATLSRGLTIEGLVSTYFLRSTKLGDTLMQMGRWFGYRRGYELLPRIWITDNCINQFEFLSDMDSDLRARIAQMESLNQTPNQYAVIIKQSPSAKLLRISSKNKMKGAIPTDMNYSGYHVQTYKFIDNETILEKNNTVVADFIKSLGNGQRGDGSLSNSCYVWRDIRFNHIYEKLLSKYTFHEKLLSFSNIGSIKEWVDGVTEKGSLQNWNIILFSLGKGEQMDFAGCKINKIHRTRKLEQESAINIGVLTDPKEKVADVRYSLLSNEGKNQYNNFTTDKVEMIRKDAGLESTPNLVIYVIDKASKVSKNTVSRLDLNAPCDITGISINIPGDRINEGYACSVMIDLAKYGLGADIDGEDEYED